MRHRAGDHRERRDCVVIVGGPDDGRADHTVRRRRSQRHRGALAGVQRAVSGRCRYCGGRPFDTAADVSVGSDVSCLFSSSTTGDSVVVLTESTTTYLGGALDGLPPDAALGVLDTTYTNVMDAPTVEHMTIGGFPGTVVTGTNSIIGTPVGYASTIVNDVVVEVSSDGAGLSATPEGFAPIVTAVAELAVAAQG